MNIRMLRNKLILFSIGLLLISCGNKSDSEEGAKLKIVAAHNQTNIESPYQVGLLKFKEVAEKEGNIEVEVHAGTIGTNEDELVEKLILGAVDVIVVSPGFMTKTGVKEIDIFALPYLFENYDHWTSVVDSEIGEEFSDLIYEKSNNEFQIIAYWSAGVRHYYGKKPVNSVEDIKGLKYRTQTSGTVADYWTQVGAIPTSAAWAELYQALQQGVVDSAENAYPYFIPMDHHKTDNGKYISETGHDYTTRLMLINGKKFATYTDAQKQAILDAAKESAIAERAAVIEDEIKYKEIAIEDGAIVNELDRQPFIDLAVPLQDEFVSSINAEAMLEKIRNKAN